MRDEPRHPNWSLEMIADSLEKLEGFTLRDFFAGCALMGYGASNFSEGWDYAEVSIYCYAQADAMMKERE